MSDRSYAVGNEAHSLERTIREAQEKLELLRRIPSSDEYEHGAMIRVVVRNKYGNTKQRTYLLLKIVDEVARDGYGKNRWYFTGVLQGRGHTTHNQVGFVRWDELVSWLVHEVVLESWDNLVTTAESVAAVATALSPSEEVPYRHDR